MKEIRIIFLFLNTSVFPALFCPIGPFEDKGLFINFIYISEH